MTTNTRDIFVTVPTEPPDMPKRFSLTGYGVWAERNYEYEGPTLSRVADEWVERGHARTSLIVEAESEMMPDGGRYEICSVWDESKGWGPWLDEMDGDHFDFDELEHQFAAGEVLEVIGSAVQGFEARYRTPPERLVITQVQNDILAPTLPFGNLVVRLFNLPVEIGEYFLVQ